MGDWTIIYGAEEKPIADWGIDTMKRRRRSQAVGTVALSAGGRLVDASDLFAYGSTVKVMRDRVKNDMGAWTGGSRWFWGRVEPWEKNGNASAENQTCILADPWWYLRERTFGYLYKFTEVLQADPVIVDKYTSHIFLNLAIDNAHPNEHLRTDEQLAIIIQNAIDAGAPIQIGTISPSIEIPIDEVRSITCQEAIQKQMRWLPDAVTFWDYSTEPYPTLHIRKVEELNPIGFDLNAGDYLTEIKIKPRPDWKRPFVRIIYEKTDFGYLNTFEDVWPDPLPAGVENQFRGLEFTVNLAGISGSIQSANLICAPILGYANDWWKQRSERLVNAKSFTLVDGSFEVKSLTEGEATDPELVNELIDPMLADWMVVRPLGVGSVPAKGQRVRATVLANITDIDGTVAQNVVLTHDFTATNAEPGPQVQTSISAAGDAVPSGLAQALWESLQNLAVEGSIVGKAAEVAAAFDLWPTINFITDRQPDWASVNAVIQEIEEDARTGETRVQFGSPDSLSAGELVDLLRVVRERFISSDPNGASTAKKSNTIQMGKLVSSKSTQVGGGQLQKLSIGDAPDGKGELIAHNGLLGNITLTKPGEDAKIAISRLDVKAIANVPALGREIAFREVPFSVQRDDGSWDCSWFVIALCGKPYQK